MKERVIRWYKIWKQNPFILKLFSGLSTILLFASIISAILITIFSEVTSYKLNFSYLGFENFLTIYSFPLKSFAAFLALFTIYVTLKRTKTAEQQIEIAVKQNRLNNFFTFRKEFVDHFKYGEYWKMINIFLPKEKTYEEVFLNIFHRLYGSYSDFSPDLISDANNELNKLRDMVNNPYLEKTRLEFKTDAEIEEFIMFVKDFKYSSSKISDVITSVVSINYLVKLKIDSNDYYKKYGADIITIVNLYFDCYFLNELNTFLYLNVNKILYLELSISYFLKAIGIDRLPSDFNKL